MEQLLEKIGLYDFWGIFIPSGIGVTFSYSIYEYLKSGKVIFLKIEENTIRWLVCAYILGIILSEIGHYLQEKVVYGKILIHVKAIKYVGEPFDYFLNRESKCLSTLEKKMCLKCFQEWKERNNIIEEDLEEAARLFFNYCDYYIEEQGKKYKAAKMQSLYGMSRSLFAFFLSLSIILICYVLYVRPEQMIWKIIFLSIMLTALFLFRMIRLNVIRLKVVMRTYCLLVNAK